MTTNQETECDKIDEEKGTGSVGINRGSNDGDRVNEDETSNSGFLVGDLVWGKIKNHPWWPGLIYDPSDASDIANKSKKVNKLLVAYFGDGSYSWCSPLQLVPFVDHYEKMSTQSSSRNFVYAVEEALEELGRRIEQSMICSCVPEDNLSGLARPEAVNAGVRPGVLLPDGSIGKLRRLWCEPARLLEYVRNVEQTFPVSNLLERVLMKRLLSAFSRVKFGYRLPIYREPQLIEGLEDKSEYVVPNTNDFSVPIRVPIQVSSEEESSGSPKVPVKGLMLTSTHKRKQKSVVEIMGEATIDNLERKNKSKITAETLSTTAACKKTASNDDSSKSAVLLASTATGIRCRKKIDNSVSHTTVVNDGIPNIVENKRLGSIKRKQDEDTGHDDTNARGTQPPSAAGRKRRKTKADNSVACSVVSNEDVQLERVKNVSIPLNELKKNENPDAVDVEASNYKLQIDQKSEKKWKLSVCDEGDTGSDLNNANVVPAQNVTQSERTYNPGSRVTNLKRIARATGTSKMEVDITTPESCDASGATESGKATSISPTKISPENPVCLQPTGDDLSQVHLNIALLKPMLNHCDGKISLEEKTSLEGELRSMLRKVGELAVKETS